MNRRFSKIYYVPGLISAILIPLVFWYYGNLKLNEPLPNVMDLGLPSKYDPNIPLSEQNNLETFRNYRFKKIEILPNTAKQNSKLYVAEIKNMQKKNEPNTGLEFILTDENSYGDFASVLNDFHIAKHDIYGVDLDKSGHIFAPVDYDDPAKDEVFSICGGVIYDFVDDQNSFQGFLNSYDHLADLPKKTYPVLFGFLLFLNISMFSIKNRFEL